MARTVLVLTREPDLHSDMVCEALAAHGAQVLRLHTKDIPAAGKVVVRQTDGGLSGRLEYRGQRIDLDEIHSVWNRRPELATFPEDWPASVHEFARAEVRQVLHGLWTASPAFWVSRPLQIRRTDLKVAQLGWARELGFQVPDTLITNDPAEARAFYERHDGNIICKALSPACINYSDGSSGLIFTTPVL